MNCYWSVKILGVTIFHESFASAWEEIRSTFRWEDLRTIARLRIGFRHMTPWAFERIPESSGR